MSPLWSNRTTKPTSQAYQYSNSISVEDLKLGFKRIGCAQVLILIPKKDLDPTLALAPSQ